MEGTRCRGPRRQPAAPGCNFVMTFGWSRFLNSGFSKVVIVTDHTTSVIPQFPYLENLSFGD